MSSNEKPPLPKISFISKKPELFCLDFKTKKKCDEFNKAQDLKNQKAWEDYYYKMKIWKESN